MAIKKEQATKPASSAPKNINIAQSLIEQMSKAGQSRVSTTTTEYPQEPLNLMNLGMIAMMLLEQMLGKKNQQPASSDFSQFLLGTQRPLNNPAASEPIAGLQNVAPATPMTTSSNYGSMNPMELMKVFLGG